MERRVHDACPFCLAPIWFWTEHTVTYRCGTIGSQLTGSHTKGRCLEPEMIQWGPL